jgi:cardiolipin synthase A/B
LQFNTAMNLHHFPHPRRVLLGVLIGAVVVALGLVIAEDQEVLRVRMPLGAQDPRMPAYVARLLGTSATSDDRYVVHRNGDALASMIDAIDKARERINLETYIYSPGDAATKMTRALSAAANRGVKVQVIVDAVGASDGDKEFETLRKAGVEVGRFHEMKHYGIEEINYRTHRKLLVVDGKVGYLGGIGIADHWLGNADSEEHWRDTQIEVRGPAVDAIEATFHENWIEVGGTVVPIDSVEIGAAPAGDSQSIVIRSAASGDANELKLAYLLTIGSARRTLDIQSPYFIPDESTLWSLEDARRRGVRVRLLTEGDITDAKPVKFASRATYAGLMAQGVEIYEYQPTMMHVKAMIADGIVSMVGSANFDNRSLELNEELVALIRDPGLGAELTRDFEADLRRSKRLDLDSWRNRPLHIRGREKAWQLFSEVF